MAALPVIVAGGGPGGSAAAISLRRAGVPVVLFDRAVFPRDKVCGDVVLPDAQEAIRALGLDASDLKARAYACTGSRYVAPGGGEVAGTFQDVDGRPVTWWMVKRLVLDHWLLDGARQAGAEVREGCEVQGVVQDDDGKVTGVRMKSADGSVHEVGASAVVGADGYSSAVARSLDVFDQPAEHLCLAARAYVKAPELPAPYLEIFTTERTLPGCTWIVPVGDGEWNVGVGVIKRDLEHLGITPRQLFEEVREQVPLFAERLRGVKVEKLKGWSLPGASQGRPIVGHGHVLVGDAGAMVDPFTGHGIHHALMAGEIAGRVLASALRDDDVTHAALMPYDRECRERFLQEAATGQTLQVLHSNATLMKLAVKLCGAHPGVRWAFMALLGHAVPRSDVFSAPQLVKALFTRGPSLPVSA